MRERPPSQQPECTLLRLPPELRQCIYEQALGGRLISLRLQASRTRGHCIVRSAYYELPDDLQSTIHLGVTRAVDKITTALLLSCRQIYLEALPILHSRNTFFLLARELEVIVSCGWGDYCLPDIRSIYLRHDYNTMFVPPWAAVFPLLRRMRLNDLTFEFEFHWIEWSEVSPQRDVLNTTWGRGVLSMRNLRAFRLFFASGDPPVYPMYRTNITDRFRQLMIGPEAEERYANFLQDVTWKL